MAIRIARQGYIVIGKSLLDCISVSCMIVIEKIENRNFEEKNIVEKILKKY